MQVIGAQTYVKEYIVSAATSLGQSLSDARLPLSKTKTAVVASNKQVATTVAKRLSKMGVKVQAAIKQLGLDYTGGKRLYRRVHIDRVKGMRRRMRRFGHIKKVTAMTRVMTTGGLPAMLYGAAVLGVPCCML